MKKQFLLMILIIIPLFAAGQENRTELLRQLEGGQNNTQDAALTATTKMATRLFGERDDLTTVILIVPSGSTVKVTGSDSTYFRVVYEDAEGYIFRKHASLNEAPSDAQPAYQQKQQVQEPQQVQQPVQKQVSRFTYLENKYGTSMAAKLNAGKIWKGMTSQMVNDSWGTPLKINRSINGNLVKEEWIYKNTWLYIENNTLVEWGPIKN